MKRLALDRDGGGLSGGGERRRRTHTEERARRKREKERAGRAREREEGEKETGVAEKRMREEKEQETEKERERGRKRDQGRRGCRKRGGRAKERNGGTLGTVYEERTRTRVFTTRTCIRRRHPGDECNDHRATKRRIERHEREIGAKAALDNETERERALFAFRLLECG